MTDERRKIMDTKYLEEIKARHEAATPGPWELSRDAGIYIDRDEDYCICGIGNEPDAEFISHARTDIPTLLAEVERMIVENVALQNTNEKLAIQNRRIINREIGRDQQIATLKKALLESIKCFNCSRCIYGRGKDCGKRPHENCADVFIRKAQEQLTHETQEAKKE